MDIISEIGFESTESPAIDSEEYEKESTLTK